MPLCERHPDDFQLATRDDHNAAKDTASIINLFTPPREIEAVERAMDTCQTCRLTEPDTFTACARAALKAGSTIDGELEACADGVIQAGIECHGDRETWRALKEAAGETIDPTRCYICDRSFLDDVVERGDGVCAGCTQVTTRHDVVAPSTARNTPPDECLECAKPMVRGTTPPEGWVRHAARGLCRRCINKVQDVAA